MSCPPIHSKQISAYAQVVSLLVLLLLITFIFLGQYALSVTAAITIGALAYLLAQFTMQSVFLLMVFVIPLATNQIIFDSEISLLVPSEPIEAIIALAFFIKLFFGYKISSDIIKHPIFIVIMAGIAIQFLAAFNAALSIVAIKAMCLKACYVVVFFVLCADLYEKKLLKHLSILKTYAFSLTFVGIIIFIKHLDNGLSKDYSGSATEPFYADHTIYSACLAFILPLPVLLMYYSKTWQINIYRRFWLACLCIAMLSFFFFTYCRAGWISLLAASLVVMAIFNGLKFKGLMLLIISALGMLYIFQHDIAESLKQNKADSNAKNATLEQQTKSVTNITSDQSNAERLNRWSCAWRMFLDKPYLGYGPGTYQFEYLSYQKKSEMTRISVTSPFNIKKGKGGTAHSEYLLLLSECGILSFLLFILSIVMFIYYAIQVFDTNQHPQTRIMIMIVFFGFCTYIIHAFFNNFLDTDKAALLYYTSMAAVMAEAIQLKKTT